MSHVPDDVDRPLCELVPVRICGQLDADLDEFCLEEVVVVVRVERRPVQPRDEEPQGIEDVGHRGHRLRRNALLFLKR